MKLRVGALLPLSLFSLHLACSSDDTPGGPGPGTGGSSMGGMGGGSGATTGSGGTGIVPEGTCETAECSTDADCIDLDQGYQCVCKDGFEGDGLKCVSSTACDGVTCSGIGQVCKIEDGAAACTCPSGFTSNNSGDCFDVNECVTDPNICGSNGECTNFSGGYRCDCRAGFALVDDECVDIDECDEGLDLCDATATCTNQAGTYSCTCPETSFGDGTFCKVSDDCSGDPCGTGTCVNSPTGYFCQCPLGTTGADCSDTSSCALGTVLNDSVTPIIADDTLRALIESTLGIGSGEDLTVADLAGTTSLSVFFSSSSKIASLDGLECWPTLRLLSLPDQEVDDLSPLSNLTRLDSLDISCNTVTDLAPLSGAQSLRNLSDSRSDLTCAAAPSLTNISALASLYQLNTLSLNGHNVDDLSPLAALVSLRSIALAENAVVDLGDLAALTDLEELLLGGNAATTAASLSGLQRLRRLSLTTNQLTSLAGIEDMSNLVYLDMSGNALTSTAGVEELSALSELLLRNSNISTLDDIAQLSRLTRLQVSSNSISSLTPLVQNPDFGGPGQLLVNDNDLVCADETTNITALQARGLTVYSDCK